MINRTQWYTHFRDILNNKTDIIDNKGQEEINTELSHYEKSTQPGILNHAITEKENLKITKCL